MDDAPPASSRVAAVDAQWLVGVCAGAVPVVGALVVDPAGWFPFTVAKWWAVLVAVLTASGCAIAVGRRPRSSSATRAADWLLVTLVALVAASAVGALDGVYAWTGTPVRHLGALAWVLFAVMYGVGRSVGSSERSRDAMWSAFVVAGAGIAAYGLYELVIERPIEFAGDSSRLGGPFGSAAYLGAALCLVGPIAVGAAFAASSRRGRVGATLLAMALAVVLAGSGSRAPVVGLLVAAVVVLALGMRRRWVAVAGFGSVAVAMVGVIAVGALRGGWDRRFGWGSRLDEWVVAARAIADRPVLGTGPEGYRLVVGQAVDAGYVRRYGEAVAVDRAHSGVLDMAVASGMVAAVAYLAVLSVVGWASVRLVRHGGVRDIAVAAAVIAYAVQQQLLFPIAELDPAFWLLAGVVVTRSFGDNVTPPGPPRRWRRGVAGLVGVGALAVAVLGVRASAADRLARDSLGAASVDDAIVRVQRATELAPLDVRHRLLLAETFERERSLGGVDRALAAAGEAADIAPRDLSVSYARAHLLRVRAAITGTSVDRANAEQAWEALLVDWPQCARCHLEAALAAFERGDVEAGDLHLETAVDLGSEGARTLARQLAAD